MRTRLHGSIDHKHFGRRARDARPPPDGGPRRRDPALSEGLGQGSSFTIRLSLPKDGEVPAPA